jgi:hypothetical protein
MYPLKTSAALFFIETCRDDNIPQARRPAPLILAWSKKNLDSRTCTDQLRLQGLWLREAGFMPNQRLRVRVMPGCLVIATE